MAVDWVLFQREESFPPSILEWELGLLSCHLPPLGREGKVVCLTLPYHTVLFALTSGGWSQDSDTRAFTRLAWSVILMGHLATLRS